MKIFCYTCGARNEYRETKPDNCNNCGGSFVSAKTEKVQEVKHKNDKTDYASLAKKYIKNNILTFDVESGD